MRFVGRGVAVALVVGTTMVACTGDGAPGDREATGRLRIVVTHSILGDVVENVVGDDAEVDVLMPRNVDPHAFEASAAQVEKLRDADLVVANGLGFESTLTEILEDATGDGVDVLELGPQIDPLPFVDVGLPKDDHEGDEDGALDPHFWMDPMRVADAARVIGRALSKIDDGVDWEAAAERYAVRVEALDAEIRQILDAVAPGDRKLVTNHEVLGYFAARYDFEVVGVVIPGGSTLAEPSARHLADLADTLRAVGVLAVFGETTQRNELVDTLRREADLDVEVVELLTESLGEPGSPGDTYFGMMREDARRIAAALS